MISLYSLIWTVLISCPLLLLIVVLRRRTACLMKYGVTFICILYAFCAIRMLIPIEVPVFQKVICDPHMFSFLMKTYADLGADKRRLALGGYFWYMGSGDYRLVDLLQHYCRWATYKVTENLL